jgi:transposase InsO family protein
MNKDTMAKLVERGVILKQYHEKQIKQDAAGLKMAISTRQVRRLYKKYLLEGLSGLLHKSHGKVSPRKIAEEVELQAISWLKEHGPDFGSTFSKEKLEEYLGIKVSVGTIRTWRIKHGLHHSRKRGSKQHFMRRIRKSLFGLMIQIDGSHHKWFEDRGPECVLLTAIDDATGRILARFAPEEETKELMILIRDYIVRYGIPHMVYTDHGGPYKVNVGNQDGSKRTQLGRALQDLGIELVHANSPQAKGRVERNHAVHQDRLVKEMRLRGISTIEAANDYLMKEYLSDFNKRFVVEPAGTQDAHRPFTRFNLDNIFSLQENRIAQNDGIIQFEKQIFQITKNRIYVRPKDTILVRKHLNGAISLWSGDIQLGYEELSAYPTKKSKKDQSKNWTEGIYKPRKESRMKPAWPAVEASEKRTF